MRQGTRANYTGNQLQKFIFNTLTQKGYFLVDRKHFNPAKYMEQAIFCPEFPVGENIYGTPTTCDFILYHPQKHPDCLIIEAKWQQSAGSVDEKFPFLVANIKEKYPHATVIVLDGGGYRDKAEDWLRGQVNDKLLKVMNMREFQKWANDGGV